MKEESLSTDYEDLFKRITNHPGEHLFLAFSAYLKSKDVLSGNSYEVQRLIAEFESGRFIDLMGLEGDRNKFNELDGHLVRYFHNFLASVKTLVDHSRTLMDREIIRENHRKVYQAKVHEIIVQSDVAKFVQDFRNYIVHRGLPKIQHSFKLESEVQWEVYILTKDLVAWEGWSKLGRQYLLRQGTKIHLQTLIKDYELRAIALHDWFVKAFLEEYAVEFAEATQLKKQWNKGFTE